MEWEKFLNHPKVVNSKISTPADKYLFGKVLHDLLACLNSFTRLCDMASFFSEEISEDTLDWVIKRKPLIEGWISILTLYWSYYEEPTQEERQDWFRLISELGEVPKEVISINWEVQKLNLPSEEKAKYIITSLVNNLQRLNSICNNIKGNEFLKLWDTDYNVDLKNHM